MNYIIEILLNLFESYIWMKMNNMFLRKKYSNITYLYLMCIAWILLCFKSCCDWNFSGTWISIATFIFCLLYISSATILAFDNKLMEKIFLVVGYLCVSALIDMIIIWGECLLVPNIEIEDMRQNTILRNCTSLIGKCLFSLLLDLLGRKRETFDQIQTQIGNVVISIISLDLGLLSVVYIFFAQVNGLSKKYIFVFVGMCVIVITLYSVLLISKLYQNSKKITEQTLFIQSMETKYKLNKDMGIVTNNLRSLRHDINNHLTIISGLVNTNQLASLKIYLKELLEQVEIANDFIIVNNEALSIILNNKKTVAKEKNIDFDCIITTDIVNLTDIEVCSLFGNLLDNAIEATDKVTNDRYIELKISGTRDGYEIHCRNPYAIKPKIVENRIKTTKADSSLHGIGTKNIYDIVYKHNGCVKYNFEEKECLVEVYIPFQK